MEARRQVHAFVQEGDDDGFSTGGGQEKDVVVPASHDVHRWVVVRECPGYGGPVADRLATAFQVARVALLLAPTPPGKGVTANVAYVGCGGWGQFIGRHV